MKNPTVLHLITWAMHFNILWVFVCIANIVSVSHEPEHS